MPVCASSLLRRRADRRRVDVDDNADHRAVAIRGPARGGRPLVSHTLIRRYYDAFNARRFTESAALFADDATFESPFTPPAPARQAYLLFASAWVAAFPDGQFVIDNVAQRNETHVRFESRAKASSRPKALITNV